MTAYIEVLDGASNPQYLAVGSGAGTTGNPYFSPAAVALGTLTDAAVTNPASSASVIAALKGVNTLLAAAIPAGTNLIGKVGIDQTTPGTTNGVQINAGTAQIGAVRQDCASAAGSTTTRLANTTAYALGQLISFSATAATVNAGPIAIAAARGTNLASIARSCRLTKSGTGQTNPYFRVHFWNAAPTVVNGDAGTFSANLDATYMGAFDVNCTRVGSGGSWGRGFMPEGGDMIFTPVSGTSNLYYLIEARGAYTPASGEVFTPYLDLV